MTKKTKVLVAVAVVLAAVLSLTGVAFAANGAVPGDALYGFDCAVESIGIGDGGLKERLAEATKLADQGESAEALAHASQAMATYGETDPDAEQAYAALVQAANAVKASNQGESTQIRSQVAEMIRWMATVEDAGQQFGPEAQVRARAIAEDAACEGDQTQTQTQAQTKTSEGTQTQTQTKTSEGTQTQSQTKTSAGTQTQSQTQSGDREQSQDGDCDQTPSTLREQSQDGDCDQTRDQDGSQTQTQTGQPAGAGQH